MPLPTGRSGGWWGAFTVTILCLSLYIRYGSNLAGVNKSTIICSLPIFLCVPPPPPHIYTRLRSRPHRLILFFVLALIVLIYLKSIPRCLEVGNAFLLHSYLQFIPGSEGTGKEREERVRKVGERETQKRCGMKDEGHLHSTISALPSLPPPLFYLET